MQFTISYLAVDRLGALAGLTPSGISPMHDLAPTVAAMRQSIGEDTLGKLDDLLVEQKLADTGEDGVVPASRFLGFLGALFVPEKCVQSRLREPDGCSDTYFILYDGAWLRLEAARGRFTVTGPFSEHTVRLCLKADAEAALAGEELRFLVERREPDRIHSAVIRSDEKGYPFFGAILTPGERSRKTYIHAFAKTAENRQWIAEMAAGDREFVLPEGETGEKPGDQSANEKKHSYRNALRGFLIALAVNAAAAVILSILRAVL